MWRAPPAAGRPGTWGSSLFPVTDFPRIAVMVRDGQMAADHMMATVVRPNAEASRTSPGCKTIKSATGRGGIRSELSVDSRLAALCDRLPKGTEPT